MMKSEQNTTSQQFSEDDLSYGAANVAYYNFNGRHVTLVLFNYTLLYGVNLFLQLFNKSVIVGKNRFPPASPESIRQYVLYGKELSNLAQMLTWMRTHRFDNTGKYVIVCESKIRTNCNENTAIDIFWEHKITNVVFMRSILKNDHEIGSQSIKGFSYSVYNDESCGRKLIDVKQVNDCVRYRSRKNCGLMFPVKFKNFNRCPLVVSTFLQVPFMWINNNNPQGADGDLLLILAGALNASLTVRTPYEGDGWGILQGDGHWTGSLGDVYYDRANFSMTSPALTISRTTYFQSSVDYNSVNVVWVTHSAIPKPSSLKLFRPFTPETFVMFALINVFVTIGALLTRTSLFISLNDRVNANVCTPVDMILHSWAIYLGMPTIKMPKKSTFLIIVYCWVWYSFLVRTFYQASLISALKYDIFYPEFETIEDVIAAEYPFGGVVALKDYYVNYPKVYNDWIGINSTEIIPTLHYLSKGTKFVLAMNRETTNSFMKTENKKVHILPQKVLRSPTALLFKKFSPLVKSINKILRYFVENGLTQKLFLDYTRTYKIEEDKNQPFTLAHYSGCYVILMSGWVISTLAFIVEIIFTLMLKSRR